MSPSFLDDERLLVDVSPSRHICLASAAYDIVDIAADALVTADH